MKHLYFGDNLEIMKNLLAQYPQGIIDLIYIDPPFNSKRNYNILFEDIDLKDTKAQREAFSDTWSSVSYWDTLNEIQLLNLNMYKFLKNLDEMNISKSAVSYLSTMAVRIIYMHKLLKETGSFYLHCDPNMSHYLKIICDLIFGSKNFRNEIIWKRQTAKKGSQFSKRTFGFSNDTILNYSKSENYYFCIPKEMVNSKDLIKKYNKIDTDGRRFRLDNIIRNKSLGERPNLVYEYKGYTPGSWGWMVSKEKLMQMEKENRIYWNSKGKPYRKYFLDEYDGKEVSNIWTDIFIAKGKERLGYPTQKPEALLERIMLASSKQGDLVADFFCGCGTTIAVAEKLQRSWLGVDISHLATNLILKRLIDTHGLSIKKEINVFGFPKDVASARELAINTDKHRVQFQDWVIEVLLGGISNPKKSGDGGFDGYITFNKSSDGKTKGIGIIEVKSGNVSIASIRAFIQVVEKQNADLGIFVCFQDQISKGMSIECNKHGKITSYNIDKIQIISIDELLEGKLPRIPGKSDITVFEKAEKYSQPSKDENLF